MSEIIIVTAYDLLEQEKAKIEKGVGETDHTNPNIKEVENDKG